ncbi:MAG: ComF family protein [Sarcina sp.]
MDKVYSCRYYSDAIRRLIVAYKSKRNFEVAEYFLSLLIEKIKEEGIEFDLVTFVPSTKETIKRRGFDHGLYLAKGISEIFKKEVVELLKKSSDSKEQKKLNSNERRKNMEKAFYSSKKIKNIEGKRILFVDDILTTGYTISICKEIIEKSYKVNIIPLTVIKSSI